MAEIMSINKLLEKKLVIPDYQRPYRWTARSVETLLNDIDGAIAESARWPEDFRYRIGSVILYKNNESDAYEIVDGQQRIISLVLLKLNLESGFTCDILDRKFTDKESQANIHNNYMLIKDWFSMKPGAAENFRQALDRLLEVVVIYVGQRTEAFQLFDSQNVRGKALDPHDLLKAYHLREMRQDPYAMERAVTAWEARSTRDIRDLFGSFLFPALNWSRKIKTGPFTARDIDPYKGIGESSDYPYARRAARAMPYFQITEPFAAGADFFGMVDHYLYLLDTVNRELEASPAYMAIKAIHQDMEMSIGFRHADNLFRCALLCYYDRFRSFDEMAVKKLLTWAFLIRVDMETLGFSTLNKYAIGESGSGYSNVIPMFFRISGARLHTEICALQLNWPSAPPSMNTERIRLLDVLEVLNGRKEASA